MTYYDLLNRIITLGIDVVWRKRAETPPKRKTQNILDIATGTDLVLELASLDAEQIIG